MKDYLAHLVRSSDESYEAAVDFSLGAYESMRLRPVRQAFPAYVSLARHGKLVGVCGFRSAEGGLFLEQFMLDTIDAYVSRQTATSVPRAEIVELGAFRVTAPAVTPLFVARVERMLLEEGFTHALALAPLETRTLADWARARESLATPRASIPGKQLDNSALTVNVIPLIRGRQ